FRFKSVTWTNTPGQLVSTSCPAIAPVAADGAAATDAAGLAVSEAARVAVVSAAAGADEVVSAGAGAAAGSLVSAGAVALAVCWAPTWKGMLVTGFPFSSKSTR